MSESLLHRHVVVVGDLRRDEFRDASTWLQRHTTVAITPSIAEAETYLRSLRAPPVLMVLVQSHPGQHDASGLQRLRCVAPLTPIIGLLGGWCEGETRSGQPCEGITRLGWHQFRARMDRDWRRFLDGVCPLWGLPPTAAEDDRWITRSRHALPSGQGRVAVVASGPVTASTLVDVCQEAGYPAVWVRSEDAVAPPGVTTCIWDIAKSRPPWKDQTRRRLQQFGPVPVVALVGFPRADDIHQLRSAGVAAVVAKPYVVEDLLWQLHKVTPP